MDISFSELEANFLSERLNTLFKQAYEQGVEDGRKKYSLPAILTKDHLVQVFQIEKPTVNKLVAIPTFPKLKDIRARYPRDRVFDWIDENTTWVQQNTNYYGRKAM